MRAAGLIHGAATPDSERWVTSEEILTADGAVVVANGRLTTVDEDAVLAEVRELVPVWLAEHAKVEARNKVFEPYMREVHRRATIRNIGINRYQGDMPLWTGQNRAFA